MVIKDQRETVKAVRKFTIQGKETDPSVQEEGLLNGVKRQLTVISEIGGYSTVSVPRLLTVVASLVVEHGLQGVRASGFVAPGLQSTSPIIVAHRFSCSAGWGIFPDQASIQPLLHWPAVSLPLRHQGSPTVDFFQFRFLGTTVEIPIAGLRLQNLHF